MSSFIKKLNQPIKTRWLIASVAVIVIMLAGWWTYAQLAPKPLGDKFEYLGRNSNEWNILADGPTYTDYYYGTDLSDEELRAYLPKAHYASSSAPWVGNGYIGIPMKFTSPYGDLTIRWYDNVGPVVKNFRLRPTDKKNVVAISSHDYEIVKKLSDF